MHLVIIYLRLRFRNILRCSFFLLLIFFTLNLPMTFACLWLRVFFLVSHILALVITCLNTRLTRLFLLHLLKCLPFFHDRELWLLLPSTCACFFLLIHSLLLIFILFPSLFLFFVLAIFFAIFALLFVSFCVFPL
jgi:hypothetical protein